MTNPQKQWRVTGVDRDSGMETSLIVEGSSAAIAKIKSEQRGVIIAEIVDLEAEGIEAVRREFERKSPNAEPAEPPAKSRTPHPGDIICPNPNCGYVGPPKRVARASVVLAVLLLLFFMLPGILYCLFRSGYRYYCPRCGFQVRADN